MRLFKLGLHKNVLCLSTTLLTSVRKQYIRKESFKLPVKGEKDMRQSSILGMEGKWRHCKKGREEDEDILVLVFDYLA